MTFDVVLQVFTPAAAALFVATGVGLFYYFQYEKRKLQEKKGLFHADADCASRLYVVS